ncbi:(S)-benzoin forming benzil reductase [Paenibacillus albiflavus]|uniref:(S)-benzoin forming benzil reductase n=1 Tax=Paenibacillus albiflavus TaxID=2545760 RepID=A0A4R4EHQ3_9BACL|nr:(S)-benzoin forming benzil reductase [Paenibacillus albiflavus]TCZ77708.1 (S)-benzoin forming benzil reductase [Paenibacillus albiflavus]
MKCFIITGTSRGLGEAIVRQLMKPEHMLICISRHKNNKLIAEAQEAGVKLEYNEFDLSNTEHLDALAARILNKIQKNELTAAYLINNAGTVLPIEPAYKSTGEAIDHSMKINAIAPMTLCANFMRWSQNLAIDKRILNISSGSGRNPYYGWSTYCAAKAALDHYTRCAALEQQDAENKVRIASVRPGIIDTDMQVQIRSSNSEDFKDVAQFIDYKESGQLLTPEAAAERMLEQMFSPTFGDVPVV